MQIQIDPKDRFFIVRVSGNVTSQGLREYIAAVWEAVEQFNRKRILLDERAAFHHADMYDAYMAGESEEFAAAAMQGLRIACLPAPDNRRKNENFETLMQNRSINYRVFESMEAAEAWLLG